MSDEYKWGKVEPKDRVIQDGWNNIEGQTMLWRDGEPSGFWYAEIKAQPSQRLKELLAEQDKSRFEEALVIKLLGEMTSELKQVPFTSVHILRWIADYCVDIRGKAIVQVPKSYGLRIQAYYNHHSMYCDWKYRIKLSNRYVYDCRLYDEYDIERRIPADKMSQLTVYEKSEQQKCIDDCRRKHLPDNHTLRGDV